MVDAEEERWLSEVQLLTRCFSFRLGDVRKVRS